VKLWIVYSEALVLELDELELEELLEPDEELLPADEL
jgi:hypothetical protein